MNARLRRFLPTILLALTLLAGFAIRLYDLQDPPLDFHPTRQLRSAIIARGAYYQLDRNADPARRDLAISLANSMEAYEPPIFEYLVGATYLLFGKEILWISRVYCALFWTVAGWAVFTLARRFASFYAALVGLAFFLYLPFAIIASRSFQPDPLMVMGLALFFLAAYRWSESGRWQDALFAGVAGGLTVLVKAVAAFPVAGAAVGLLLPAWGLRRILKNRQAWVVAALLAVPSLFYYLLGLGQRGGAFLSFWTLSLSHLVLTSQFYSGWLGMLHGLFGLATLFVALIGVLLARPPARGMLVGGWIGYFLYGLVFPYQMTTHEYYHLMLLPLVALSLAPALDRLLTALAGQRWWWRAAAAGLFLFAAGYNLYAARSVLYVADYRSEEKVWQRMGQELPQNGKIIALTSEYGDRLKYYGWRAIAGYWPLRADMALSELAGNSKMDFPSYFADATQNMEFFLVTAFGELDAQPELKAELEQHYPLAGQGDGYLLYDLRRAKEK